MTNKREITLDISEAEKNVLLHALGRGTIDTGLKDVARDLEARIKLAWTEGMTDEDAALENYAHEAYLHAVNR